MINFYNKQLLNMNFWWFLNDFFHGLFHRFSKDSSSSRSGTPTPMEITHRASVIRATTDSPLSPPLQSNRPRPYPRSLLDIWIARTTKPKRPDFTGRATAEPLGRGCSIARLYTNLTTEPSNLPPAMDTT